MEAARGAARHGGRPGAARRAAVAPAATGDPGRPGRTTIRRAARGVAGRRRAHWVRLYDVLPGNSRIAATDLSDAALVALGRDRGAPRRVALRGFSTPARGG